MDVSAYTGLLKRTVSRVPAGRFCESWNGRALGGVSRFSGKTGSGLTGCCSNGVWRSPSRALWSVGVPAGRVQATAQSRSSVSGHRGLGFGPPNCEVKLIFAPHFLATGGNLNTRHDLIKSMTWGWHFRGRRVFFAKSYFLCTLRKAWYARTRATGGSGGHGALRLHLRVNPWRTVIVSGLVSLELALRVSSHSHVHRSDSRHRQH
jgi:hypothetical protein